MQEMFALSLGQKLQTFFFFINNEIHINKIIVSCLFYVVIRAVPLPRAGI